MLIWIQTFEKPPGSIVSIYTPSFSSLSEVQLLIFFLYSHKNISELILCTAHWQTFVFDLSSYQSTLKILFQEFETGSETESQLAVVTMKIMQALQNNLDGKSKQYKDPALTYIFLMNNIHYMVRSVRRYVPCYVSGVVFLEASLFNTPSCLHT